MGRFTLPLIGGNGNWGAALNRNFNLIDTELSRMNGTINSLHSIIGGKTPYIKMDDEQYFVGFEEIQNEKEEYIVNIYYYSKSPINAAKEAPGENDKPTLYYNSTLKEWEKSRPVIGLGAYVLFYIYVSEESVEGGSTEESVEGGSTKRESLLPGEQSFERGDFAVIVEEFGSIYGNNYVSSIYKKFPALGEYYLPVENANKPYEFTLVPTNYVDWYKLAAVNNPRIIYDLPSIGLSTFNYFSFTKTTEGGATFTINGVTPPDGATGFNAEKQIGTIDLAFLDYNAQDYTLNINWYIGIAPIFISHYIEKTTTEDGKIKLTIIFDCSGIIPSETLKCEVSVSHRSDMVYPVAIIEGQI